MEFFKKHKFTTIFLIILSIYIYQNYTRIVTPNNKINKNSYHYVNDLYMSDGRIYNNYLNDTEKKMYDLLFQNAKKHVRQITFPSYEIGCKDFEDCYEVISKVNNALYVDHPELIEFGGVKDVFMEGLDVEINVKYSTNPLFAKLGVEKIKRIIFDIKEATKDMNDLAKIDYVYSWIAKNTKYDQTFTLSAKNQSAYNVFIHKEAVCAGFAKASQIIFQNIGIKSYGIIGNSTGYHMWNVIEYKGKYYYYDSTVASSTYKNKSGLIQEEMNYYTAEYPDWYPKIEKTRMKP